MSYEQSPFRRNLNSNKKRVNTKSLSLSWREKYDKAAARIFTPSKLDQKLGLV
jgi:hypothetical protein